LNYPAERVCMVDDLLNEYKLVGKTKDGVSTLLGTPTATEYFKNENNIVYYLGDERELISIDSEWLVISFNSNQKVIKYEIHTD
jgi:outer membrane protein assembly factor BamE (lipoprotein component of BamABCDE complex)